jgi:hypothetical protein
MLRKTWPENLACSSSPRVAAAQGTRPSELASLRAEGLSLPGLDRRSECWLARGDGLLISRDGSKYANTHDE